MTEYKIRRREIRLRDFVCEASIGIHDFERQARQRVLINVTLTLRDVPPARDDISEVLDYDFLRDEIRDLVRDRYFNLQETLCEEILKLCFRSPRVQQAEVYLQKPDVYPDCRSVGLYMTAEKS